jgi:hypothetical protein
VHLFTIISWGLLALDALLGLLILRRRWRRATTPDQPRLPAPPRSSIRGRNGKMMKVTPDDAPGRAEPAGGRGSWLVKALGGRGLAGGLAAGAGPLAVGVQRPGWTAARGDRRRRTPTGCPTAPSWPTTWPGRALGDRVRPARLRGRPGLAHRRARRRPGWPGPAGRDRRRSGCGGAGTPTPLRSPRLGRTRGARPRLTARQLACSSATAAAMCDRWVSAWG